MDLAALALGAALAIGLGTHAQAAAPANYSRACTKSRRVSCRVRQRSGESALRGWPSCGAPHRSPDIPPPRLLNRADMAAHPVLLRQARAAMNSKRASRGNPASPKSLCMVMADRMNARRKRAYSPGLWPPP